MRLSFGNAALAATALPTTFALSLPQFSPRDGNIFERDLSFSSGGLSTNCVPVGFLPSDASAKSPRYSMASINSKLGAKASTYGWYGQISSTSFDGSQFTQVLNDVKSSGAIFVASVMPKIEFSQVSPSVAQQVATLMKKFTDEGIEVWLRFGHEVNWYIVRILDSGYDSMKTKSS